MSYEACDILPSLLYIYSDLVKTAIGLKDIRSIEQFFRDAGVKIHEIGKKKCVTCEDLLNVVKNLRAVMKYVGKTNISKQIEDLE